MIVLSLTLHLFTDSLIIIIAKKNKITNLHNLMIMLYIKLNLQHNCYEVTLHSNVQNDKLEIVLKNRVNTLSLLGQVEGLTAIKTDEELISIICQTFNDFGICIAHIDRGEYIAYSIGTYIIQITYYITLKNDIGEWLS